MASIDEHGQQDEEFHGLPLAERMNVLQVGIANGEGCVLVLAQIRKCYKRPVMGGPDGMCYGFQAL